MCAYGLIMTKLNLKNKIPKTKEELAHIRKLNRDRSARMERDITQKINGRRTPMSGAGFVKADGIVQLPNDQGIALIECKVTSSIHTKHGPQVAFKLDWLSKLEEDIQSMRLLGSRFGALIVKFHGTSRIYVFINKKYLTQIQTMLDVVIAQDNDMVIEITAWNTGRLKRITKIPEKIFAAHTHGTLRTVDSEYYICTFTEFMQWFKKDTTLNES